MGVADFLAPAAHRKTGFGAGRMSQEDLDEIARELNGPPRGRRLAPVGRPPVVLEGALTRGRVAQTCVFAETAST